MPGSLSLIFDLTVSTEANNFLLNNVPRALVDRLTVEFTEEIIQDTDGYDLFKPYEDLFLTVSERTDMFRELISSEDLSKIRCKARDEKTSGVDKDNKLNDIYGNKYRIPLDHEIMGPSSQELFLMGLSEKLQF